MIAVIEHVNCPAHESELGICTTWCNRALCAKRATVVAVVRRTILQRIARASRIRTARKHLQQLQTYHDQIARDPRTKEPTLTDWRLRIGAARVELALAEAP